jgi:DNA-binding XRE family transcriptional regulator
MQVVFPSAERYDDSPLSGTDSMDDSTISPRQCRAARCWLGLTQREMAAKAGLEMQTIMHFELGRGTPRKATILVLTIFFEQAGIRLDEQRNLVLPQ